MFFFLILLLIALLGIRRACDKNSDHMSKEMVNSIKGFFIFMIFLGHIFSSEDFSHPYLDDIYYKYVRLRTGQCVVTMFLFYSGFGIMESIKNMGMEYVDKIPVKRILNVLLQFDSAVLLFAVYRLMTGTHYGVKKMIQSLVGWESIGNSNWYIFCVLCLYVFTYISFVVFRNNHIKAVFGVFVLTILYIAVLHNEGKLRCWYDTILCYTLGMIFSLYRYKIEAVINESRKTWLFFLGIFMVGHYMAFYYRNDNAILYEVWVFCFVAAIVTFTMRYVFDSAILRWGGDHLFGLYILQRLPMMILKPYMLTAHASVLQKYMYVAVCFAATIVMVVMYDMTIGKGIKYLIKRLTI